MLASRRFLICSALAGSLVSFGCKKGDNTGPEEPPPPPPPITAFPVVSTFDTGTEGWSISGDAQGGSGHPTYQTDGGNPGGYISAKDDIQNDAWFFVAPSKFLGDASLAYGKSLRFDLITNDTTQSSAKTLGVELVGGGIRLQHENLNPGIAWTSYTIRLDETGGWSNEDTGQPATAAEIQSVLKSLTALRIRGEYRQDADTGGLDNVRFGE